MGVVYKAEDLKLGRLVALKFLHPHLAVEEDSKTRFVQEARAASALDHPNICTIYEIDETEDGQLFIAMAYYEGETLKRRLARGGLALPTTLDLAVQIAKGLARAHEAGIVHRDIKPANVVVTTRGEAKIVDFGLARAAGQMRLTGSGATLGTLAYMSPEQARGQEVDWRTDIWSFGVLLYEMLAGQLPFSGLGEALVYAIQNEDPPPLGSLRPELPAELQPVLGTSLEKDRNARYQRIGELLGELEAVRNQLDSGPTLARPAPSPEPRRIVVLPLANISPDPRDEYFADGMTGELISCLSRLSGLRVIARTSAMQYKGAAKSVSQIGRELKVGTVLEGSVRKAGDRLRITVQLIEAQSQENLWSADFDRELKDVFAIQSEVAQRVAEALQVRLLQGEGRVLPRRATDNLGAFSFYLQGRYYWNKRTPEAFREAIDCFEQAIQKDRGYALAYAGLADAYALLGDAGDAAIPPTKAFSRAKTAVEKALELDDTLAEAHTSLAHLRMHDYDWTAAERAFQRAVELNPGYATTYHWRGLYLAALGRPEEALAAFKRALELDPVSLAIHTDLGVLSYYARRYDEAIAQYHRVLQMDPGFVRAHVTLGSAYALKGMYAEAFAALRKAMELSGDRSRVAALARAYALSGRREEALGAIEELRQLAAERYVSPYAVALVYSALGASEPAFEWLERAYQEMAGDMVYIKVDPYLDPLRSDARFGALLRKVNLAS
jgi:serine/threonine-protein kinase